MVCFLFFFGAATAALPGALLFVRFFFAITRKGRGTRGCSRMLKALLLRKDTVAPLTPKLLILFNQHGLSIQGVSLIPILGASVDHVFRIWPVKILLGLPPSDRDPSSALLSSLGIQRTAHLIFRAKQYATYLRI